MYRDYAPFKPMEFEDLNDFGQLALRTKSGRLFHRTLADELDGILDDAAGSVKHPAATNLLARFREAWQEYMTAACKAHDANQASP